MSASVFPARAGMSPYRWLGDGAPAGVPRASGDEPRRILSGQARVGCSPRERG